MVEAVYDFSAIRKRTHAFDDTPPQNQVIEAKPVEQQDWRVYWMDNPCEAHGYAACASCKPWGA